MESIVVLIMLLRSNMSCVLWCDESLTHESRQIGDAAWSVVVVSRRESGNEESRTSAPVPSECMKETAASFRTCRNTSGAGKLSRYNLTSVKTC